MEPSQYIGDTLSVDLNKVDTKLPLYQQNLWTYI